VTSPDGIARARLLLRCIEKRPARGTIQERVLLEALKFEDLLSLLRTQVLVASNRADQETIEKLMRNFANRVMPDLQREADEKAERVKKEFEELAGKSFRVVPAAGVENESRMIERAQGGLFSRLKRKR